MTNPKFPLRLRSVARKPKSAAQDLAFGRDELASAIRFLDGAAPPAIVADLRAALCALPAATVMSLGCRDCNGDVSLDQPDFVEDRICRSCADAYDAAAAERRAGMTTARRRRKAA